MLLSYSPDTKTGIEAPFCATEGTVKIHQWVYRLDENNSAYQGKLYAILKALVWIESNPSRSIPNLIDSICGLQAVEMQRTKDPLVLQIKIKLKSLTHRTSLGDISAHKGTFGNELADKLAKQTA